MGNFADTIKNTSPAKGDLSIFFMGQAGFIIKDSEGKLYAIDVYFSDCCEREFGFKRLMPKILEPSEVVFDYVITTHGHFDHLDIDAIPTLMANGRTELYTTRDGIEECEKIKITERINEIRRGDTLKIGNLTVTAVFCDHGELAPHAVGFVIEYGGEKIYLVGDSAYSPDKVAYLADENINIMFVPINGAFGN